MTNPGASVIICTFNGRNRISSTIEHLQKQDTGKELKWEVIVVDNCSTDQTDDFVQALWKNKNVTEFKVIRENNPGVINARIRGVAEAQYEYACFIDDDNLPDKNWVAEVFKTFSKHPEIAACGGKTIPVFESTAPDWFPVVSHAFACGQQRQEGSGYIDALWGAGLCIRKSSWNYLMERGFKNHLAGRTRSDLLAGEDSEICLGLRLAGFKLWYDEGLTLRHFIPAVKLEIGSIIKMMIGLGKSEVILRIYKSMLDSSVRIHSNWIQEYFATVYYYFKKFIVVSIKHKLLRKSYSVPDTQYFFVKGYLNYLFRLKSNYGLIQKEIQAFYNNLKI